MRWQQIATSECLYRSRSKALHRFFISVLKVYAVAQPHLNHLEPVRIVTYGLSVVLDKKTTYAGKLVGTHSAFGRQRSHCLFHDTEGVELAPGCNLYISPG